MSQFKSNNVYNNCIERVLYSSYLCPSLCAATCITMVLKRHYTYLPICPSSCAAVCKTMALKGCSTYLLMSINVYNNCIERMLYGTYLCPCSCAAMCITKTLKRCSTVPTYIKFMYSCVYNNVIESMLYV